MLNRYVSNDSSKKKGGRLFIDFFDCKIQRYKSKIKDYLRPFVNNCVDVRRIESRLLRMEILQYYQDEKRRALLDQDAKLFLKWLDDNFFADCLEHDRLLAGKGCSQSKDIERYGDLKIYRMESGIYYAKCNGFKVYLSWDESLARRYWVDLVREQLPESPHCYFDANCSYDFPENAILADVGAAEGFLSAKYFSRIKKAYLFEPDEKWLRKLKKTYAGYEDKIEIVSGFVGNGSGCIKLDDFFAGKEKPTVIKIDVEGSEFDVLQGASRLISDNSLPMHLVACLYHRKSDEKEICSVVQDHFQFSYSPGFFWYKYEEDAVMPFFRRGVLRAFR